MSGANFFKYFTLAALASTLLFFGFQLLLPIKPYGDFLMWSLIFFSFMALLAYLFGELLMRKRDGVGYLVLIIGNVFLKLILCFVFVALYAKKTSPPDKYFMIPFLITYLVYTGYEMYFMSVQARGKR